jgi:hypothetical protein
MNSQNAYRDSVLYTIPTTPEQEQAMRDCSEKFRGKDMPDLKKDPLGALNDNCATRTAAALNAGGVNVGNPSTPAALQRALNGLMNQGGATGANVSGSHK